MFLAAFFFALMAAGVKQASLTVSTGKIVFFRSLAIVLVSILAARGFSRHTTGLRSQESVTKGSVRRQIVGLRIAQALCNATALACYFIALKLISVPSAIALNYMSTIWLAILALVLSWRSATPRHAIRAMLTSFAGFVGIVLMLNPGVDTASISMIGVALGVISGILAAGSYFMMRILGKCGVRTGVLVTDSALAALVLSAALVLYGQGIFGVLDIPATGWAWLMGVCVSGYIGQWLLTQAYATGESVQIGIVQFTGIAHGALLSGLLFGVNLTAAGWVGVVLIIAAAALVPRSSQT